MAQNTTTGSYTEDSLDRYLKEISKVKLLTPEQEIEYAKRIREGDHSALEELTKANLRFVVSVAKQYQNQGLTLGDLINAGNLGLLKAASRFDETRGFKFISYAVWWIRQAILQALAEQARIVRLPLNRIGMLNKIERVFTSLEQEYEREPSANEIASALDIKVNDVFDAFNSQSGYISLDAPLNREEENRLIDLLENSEQPSPDNQLLSESLVIEIERALHTLSKREEEIVRLYFGIGIDNPLTLEEIGEKFKLTRERVRQLKEKALKRLRHATRSRQLRKYLE